VTYRGRIGPRHQGQRKEQKMEKTNVVVAGRGTIIKKSLGAGSSSGLRKKVRHTLARARKGLG